jgi:hypothetical protein
MGFTYGHVVGLSVLASAMTLVAVTILFQRVARTWTLAGLSGALFYGSVSYATLFSPLGVHNFGVCMLVVAVAVATPVMANLSGWARSCVRAVAALGAVTVVAAYSHFTNALLLPLACVLGLIWAPGLAVRQRSQLAVLYDVIICVGLAPVGVVTAFLHQTHDGFLVFANASSGLGTYLAGMPQRALVWVVSGMRLVSPPGIVAGIMGLAGMASVTRFRLPFFLLVAHFSWYCLAPGFIWNGSNTYLRTYNYVIPFLAIGMGWLLLQVIRPESVLTRCGGIRMVASACLVWHLAIQVPVNGWEGWARGHAPDFAVDYLEGQGELRPIVRSIERRVVGEPVLFWDFPERFVYLSLAREPGNAVGSALDSTGRGGQFLKTRMPAKGYVAAIQSGSFSEEDLNAALLRRHAGDAGIKLVARWQCSIPAYGPFALYRMQLR